VKDVRRFRLKIEKNNYVNGTMRKSFRKKVKKKYSINIHKVISVPSPLYESESWFMRERKPKE